MGPNETQTFNNGMQKILPHLVALISCWQNCNSVYKLFTTKKISGTGRFTKTNAKRCPKLCSESNSKILPLKDLLPQILDRLPATRLRSKNTVYLAFESLLYKDVRHKINALLAPNAGNFSGGAYANVDIAEPSSKLITPIHVCIPSPLSVRACNCLLASSTNFPTSTFHA